MKKFLLGLMLSMALVVSAAQAEVTTGEMAPNFTLTDTNGQPHQLSDLKGKFVVLEWVNYECPFVVKQYKSSNMQNLQKKYTEQGVVWLSINSSAEGKQGFYQPAEVNQIMQNSKAVPTAYLLDANGEVGRLYGAQTTPHMYVINPEGKLVYQGAIDSIPSFDIADIEKAENYVAAALDSTMAGQEVATATTKSYGCSIKY